MPMRGRPGVFDEYPEEDVQERTYVDEKGRSWPYRTYRKNVQPGGLWFWSLNGTMMPPVPRDPQGPFASREAADEACRQWIATWERPN